MPVLLVVGVSDILYKSLPTWQKNIERDIKRIDGVSIGKIKYAYRDKEFHVDLESKKNWKDFILRLTMYYFLLAIRNKGQVGKVKFRILFYSEKYFNPFPI